MSYQNTANCSMPNPAYQMHMTREHFSNKTPGQIGAHFSSQGVMAIRRGVLFIPQSFDYLSFLLSLNLGRPNVCLKKWFQIFLIKRLGGARGVVVIAVGNEHGDTSSNPGRYWLHFT